jgi:Domain of unknown function (DUF4167)
MYVTLAQAAALTGDAVETENCYQHAEHYYRVMNERTRVGNPSANKRSRQSAHLSIFRGYLRPYAAANAQISGKTVR